MDDETRPTELPAASRSRPRPALPRPVLPVVAAPVRGRRPRGAPPREPRALARRRDWSLTLAVVVTLAAALLLGSPPRRRAPVRPGRQRVRRRDAPGPARGPAQHLGNFLAHFPGFADQSTLGTRSTRRSIGAVRAGRPDGAVDYATRSSRCSPGPAFFAVDGADRPAPAAPRRRPGLLLGDDTTAPRPAAAIFRGQTVEPRDVSRARPHDLGRRQRRLRARRAPGPHRRPGDGSPGARREGRRDRHGQERPTYSAARAALGLDRLAHDVRERQRRSAAAARAECRAGHRRTWPR